MYNDPAESDSRVNEWGTNDISTDFLNLYAPADIDFTTNWYLNVSSGYYHYHNGAYHHHKYNNGAAIPNPTAARRLAKSD